MLLYEHFKKKNKDKDENKIKELLMNVLESHYGSLDKCVVETNVEERYWKKVVEMVNEYKKIN